MIFFIDILVFFLIYLMLIISMNFLIGKAGIFFIGHIAFFAIGAYSSAIISTEISPIIAFFIGATISGIIAFVISIIPIKLSGHYLLISSLGICEIVRSIANNLELTKGAEGLLISTHFLPFIVFSQKTDLILIILFVLFLEIIYFNKLNNSLKGKLFKAMRDDSLLLTSYGISIKSLKIESLVISAIWASFAGSFYAHISRFIDPTSFSIEQTLIVFIALLIGGINSIKGSIIAAIIIIVLPNTLRFIHLPANIINPIHQIIFAIIIIVILSFKPKGVFGKNLK